MTYRRWDLSYWTTLPMGIATYKSTFIVHEQIKSRNNNYEIQKWDRRNVPNPVPRPPIKIRTMDLHITVSNTDLVPISIRFFNKCSIVHTMKWGSTTLPYSRVVPPTLCDRSKRPVEPTVNRPCRVTITTTRVVFILICIQNILIFKKVFI